MMLPMVFPMVNTTQPYAWGSRTAIPDLFGLPNPDGEPMAEVWMGAHARAPSRLLTADGEIPLDRFIARDPVRALGRDVAHRYGGRLPFLFKILAAAEPLSIQAHPGLDQAREGFAREEAAGIPRDAPERNYRDDNHKPELIYALRPFWGLRGFRAAGEIRDEFERLGAVAPVADVLPRDDTGLAPFFRALVTTGGAPRARLVDAAIRHARSRWPDRGRRPLTGDPLARYFWVQRLAVHYPGDAGILAPLYLNVFSLEPGEATYQPAGVLHAYLEGVGAELMANSDNVLRGGLTPKHVDVEELLRVGVFREEPEVVITGREEMGRAAVGGAAERAGAEVDRGECATRVFDAPFEEFRFFRLDVDDPCAVRGGRPLILFCAEGAVTLADGPRSLTLGPGRSAFAPAFAGNVSVTGEGALLCATVGGGAG